MLEKIIKKASSFDFSKIKLAIVYGGGFEESDVSRMSFNSIAKTLKASDFLKIDAINYSENIVFDIQKSNPDIVFNAMHGEFGEDGGLPVICEFLGVKYTHSGKTASVIGMQKDMCKILFNHHGIEIAKSVKITKKDLDENAMKLLFDKVGSDKLVIKPNDGGSSIGICIIEKGVKMDLSSSIKAKSEHFLVEEFIDGDDYCVPVLKGKSLGVLQLSPKSGFYDYENKYTDGKTEHIFPPKIPQDVCDKMMNWAEIAHNSISCHTLSRSDFRYDQKTSKIAISEINTHPGMTSNSIFPEVALYCGIDFQTLLKIIIYDGYFR